MATLILTAVGTALGGPIGGAIGAMIGQRADAAIFAPKTRQGPRLGELAVQTSSYGTMIPKIFGTMRVAGTVIWATDIREERSKGGGGKGQAKTINYSYSASFAVALSGRPVTSIGRIWADGKLLRGAGGDFKSRTGFRLHLGNEEQSVDPLIASAEGIGQTPAFRGVAYAVFEDFQLADFGNRIPSLTFEVVGDAAPVSIGAIAEELSDGAIMGGETSSVIGYAASGDSIRGAVEALSDILPISLIQDEHGLVMAVTGGTPTVVTKAEAGAGSKGESGRTEIVRRAAGSVADEVSLAYHDIDRDYQTGLQRAGRSGSGVRSDRRALPAVLTADTAKGIAEARLAALWLGRETAKLHLPSRRSKIRPGASVSIEGQNGIWKVERWTLGTAGVVGLELVRTSRGLPGAASADPGRADEQPDFQAGSTVIHLLDIPLYEDQLSDRPRLFAVAGGSEEGWRQASLLTSYDNGMSWSDAGSTAGAAMIGRALTELGPAGSEMMDLRNSLDVQLISTNMWLEGRTDAAIAGGSNLALLGNELIQFGSVEALGDGRFRLSRFLRGRRGTEWAADGHAANDLFALIESAAVSAIEPSLALIGVEMRLLATGLGDEDGVETRHVVSGETVRPPSPVHVRAERLPSGDITITWVRRSRGGWAWLGDTPLGEEKESYRIRLSGSGFERAAAIAEPTFLYSTEDQAADGLSGPLSIELRQIGTVAASRPARITFS